MWVPLDCLVLLFPIKVFLIPILLSMKISCMHPLSIPLLALIMYLVLMKMSKILCLHLSLWLLWTMPQSPLLITLFCRMLETVNSVIEDIVSENNVMLMTLMLTLLTKLSLWIFFISFFETSVDFTSDTNPSASVDTFASVTTTSTDPLEPLNDVAPNYFFKDNVVLAHLVRRSKRAREYPTVSFGAQILVMLRRLQKANILVRVLPKVPKS